MEGVKKVVHKESQHSGFTLTFGRGGMAGVEGGGGPVDISWGGQGLTLSRGANALFMPSLAVPSAPVPAREREGGKERKMGGRKRQVRFSSYNVKHLQ